MEAASSKRTNCGRYHSIAKTKWGESFQKSQQCQKLRRKQVKQELGTHRMKVFSSLGKSTVCGVVGTEARLQLLEE